MEMINMVSLQWKNGADRNQTTNVDDGGNQA